MSTTHPPVVPVVMSHQIPFRQPAITVPLSWSFAGSCTTHNHQLSNLLPRKDQSSTNLATSSSQSRKRSAPDELNPNDPQLGLLSKSISGLPKRAKRSITTLGLGHNPDGREHNEDQIDLGTALISLTNNQLVNLLQGLIQQKPELKPTIRSLLPSPSLESILLKLSEVENQLAESIPNKRTNREEYIWNRVRVPLTTYVNDCLSCLEISSKTLERRCSTQEGRRELSEIYGAVSDQLNLLSQLSLSVSRIEYLLPNLSIQPPSKEDPHQDLNWNVSYPFQFILIPSLFQNWKAFIETIHKLIFVDRMILSESLIRKWFNLLDELSSSHHSLHHHLLNRLPSPHDNHTVQSLMIAIRDEAQNRFGCLVGLKR